MQATAVSIPGLLVFTPQRHIDQRGFFTRTFDAQVARRTGIDPTAFVQDGVSRSVN
jgi:dTDP-4-dehydrorhamnose 3,5-epimerase